MLRGTAGRALKGLPTKRMVSAGGSLAMHASRTALQLVTSILLARLLLPAGLGEYSFVVALATVCAIPAQLGLNTLLLRDTAKYLATSDHGRMRGLWLWALSRSLIATAGFMVLWLGIGVFRQDSGTTTQILGAFLLPTMVILNLGEAALQGAGRPLVAMVFGYMLRPLVFIGLIFAVASVSGGINPETAVALQLVSHLIAAVGLCLALRLFLRRRISNLQPQFEGQAWWASSRSFLFFHLMWIVLSQADMIFLGLLSSSREVGLYRVASTGAGFVYMAMNALNAIVGERLAALNSLNDRTGMQRITRIAGLAAFTLAAPIAVAFFAGGEQLLELLFGPEYRPATTALVVLSIGQLVQVASGYAPTLLAMTNSETTNAIVLGLTAALNIVLCLLLIPALGALGAAVSTATAIGLQSVVMWWLVRKRMNIWTSVFESILLTITAGRR